MSSIPWYEQPYPGGSMVKVPGFPRRLDVEDKPMDGPDVVAYKRTVSRAGRWPWQDFNDSYTMDFARGGKPGVQSSGVAGVQDQSQGQVPVSGIIGHDTFNYLRSIRIPEPLPHAGEPAMDANAQTLVAEAWHQYHGKPPPATVRLAALEEARKYIGVTESPSGSNDQQFGSWYGMNGVPWCAIFATFCFECGAPGGSPSFEKGIHYSYVPYIVSDARNARRGLTVTVSPIPGDLVAYDWAWDGTFDHVGIFETGNAHSWKAIEANTSTSNNSNGGQVMRRSRAATDADVVFVRVAEPG